MSSGIQLSGNEMLNKKVLSSRRKVRIDEADCRETGRLFHARAAATGNAQSPRLDRLKAEAVYSYLTLHLQGTSIINEWALYRQKLESMFCIFLLLIVYEYRWEFCLKTRTCRPETYLCQNNLTHNRRIIINRHSTSFRIVSSFQCQWIANEGPHDVMSYYYNRKRVSSNTALVKKIKNYTFAFMILW